MRRIDALPLVPKPVLFLILFLIPTFLVAQPGLIVNEISQGSTGGREFAELVVVGDPCGTVDLRGYIFDDNSGEFTDCGPGPNNGALSGTGIAGGHVRFSMDPIWQAVPVGTIIVVYAFDPFDASAQAEIGALTPDYTDSNCDFVRVCPINASNGFMEMDINTPSSPSGTPCPANRTCPNGGSGNPFYTPANYIPLDDQSFAYIGRLGMRNDGDAFQIRNPNGTYFHGISYGTADGGCTTAPQFDGGPDGMHLPAGGGGNMAHQFVNSLNDDFRNISNYTSVTASVGQSPGEPNSCANAEWIGSLRRPPESVFQTPGGGCNTNLMDAPISICIGEQATVNFPFNSNSCSSDSYSWSFSGSGGITIISGTNGTFFTFEGASAGTVDVVITATLDNNLLYTQGGCAGPMFPESLDYTFPVTITAGPNAFPANLSECADGSGQATFDLTTLDNTVNGGTAFPVTWYSDSQGNFPIPNPGNYMSGATIVYAQVADGPCLSALVNVILNILPPAPAMGTQIIGCDQGGGIGLFDLTSIEPIINLGSGDPVDFWLDPAATIPINNPGNYSSSTGVIFATVDDGVCPSNPVQINLFVDPAPNPNNTFITVSPMQSCGPANVTVTFTTPGFGIYDIEMAYGNSTNGYNIYNGSNITTGSTAIFPITETTEFILTSAALDGNPNCTVVFSTPVTLIVTITDAPDLDLITAPTICAGEEINLNDYVDDLNNSGITITFHTNDPPTLGNEIGPLVSPGADITYYAYADGGPGCEDVLAIPVTITTGGMPMLGTASLCDTDGLLDLTTLQDPNFPNGTWSGTGVTGTDFDPTGLSGPIMVTFTPTDCGEAAMTTITVTGPGTPVLGTAMICDLDGLFDLNTLLDPNFPNGSWSGTGISGTDFDPTGLSGPIMVTFTPSGGCATPAMTTIDVNVGVTPVLGTASICEGDGLFDLTTLEDINFPNGNWSGTGVTGTDFDPTGLSGPIMVTFTSSDPCVAPAMTTIDVGVNDTPVLGTTAICQTANPLDLTTLNDPNYPNGTWSGPGVSGNTFDPSAQNGMVTLDYQDDGACILLASTMVNVLSVPMVTNVTFNCDPTNTTYTVTFDISGGDGGPYFVDGIQLPSTTYTSAVINSGDLYSFDVDDGNDCGPVVEAGSFNCACSTNSGTIDVNAGPLYICENNDFSVASFFNNDEVLDQDDILEFILHDNPGGTLGTILATSPDGNFIYPGGVVLNQSYYISPVAGTDDGNGNVDLADGCLSVGAGIEVIFYQLIINTNSGTSICPDECFDWEIQLEGLPDFTLSYEVVAAGMIFPESAISPDSNFVITICPGDYGVTEGLIELQLVDLVDDNCLIALNGQTDIVVLPIPETQINQTLCPGESLMVNGTTYDEATPSGTEILPDAAFNGCDSIIQVALDFHLPAEEMLVQTLCPGESIMVNGTTYDEATPSGTEILGGASINGCDSTIVIDLSFHLEAIGNLVSTLCPGESILINGTTYDEATPTGTEILGGASINGCDSTLNVMLDFFDPAENLIQQELCEGNSIVVNGTTYDEVTPAGIEILIGASANGCDSTITVDLSFTAAVTNLIDDMLCPGESITVNGALYDEVTPIGQETIIGGSFLGCDSIIDIDLSYFAEAENLIDQTLCFGESLMINGTIYDAAMPSGTEIIINGATSGCDSTIQIDLAFQPFAEGSISDELCNGESIFVNGTEYDEGNPMGTEVLTNGASTGCDSTINVALTFIPPASSMLDEVLCPGESIVVNGTTYDEATPFGTEILDNASWQGCDSTVVISLDFITVENGMVTDQLCPGESMIVNGTVYDETTPTGTETIIDGSYLGCDSTINVALTFFPVSEGDFSQTLCPGGSIVINGTTYDGDMTSGVEIFPNAAYTGCDSLLNVSIDFAMPALGSLNEVLCEGESILINGTIYDENTPSGTEIFMGGSYLGCDSTLSVSVSFLPNSEETITLTLNPGESITVNGVVYDENNPTGMELLPGTSANGCDSLIIVFLNFNVDQASLQSLAPSCFGGDNGIITIDSLPLAVGPYLVSVDGLAFGEFDAFPIDLTGLVSGQYDITVIDDNGDVFTYEIIVPAGQIILLDAGDDVDITLGESIELTPQASFLPDSVAWFPPIYLSCDSCLYTDVIMPLQTIEYQVSAFDEFGCEIQDLVTVRVTNEINVYIPNVFSPNGDGLNDEFFLQAGPEVANIRQMQIFDRWGDLVFRAQNIAPNDPKLGWNGYHKGKLMNPAVFVFWMEIEFIDGSREILKGDVTILR